MTTEERKKAIDEMDYRTMFSLWRFEKSGSPWFSGEVGDYFAALFKKRRAEVGPEEHTRISKELSW